jgi:hypothetical protein
MVFEEIQTVIAHKAERRDLVFGLLNQNLRAKDRRKRWIQEIIQGNLRLI